MHIPMLSRLLLCALPFLVTAVVVTSACAEGLFGNGLPGLPSFGTSAGGSAGCGEKLGPTSKLEAYVGWMDDRQGTSISVDATGIGVGGVNSVQHHLANRGLWLGLSDVLCLSDRLSFVASGWYLVPSNSSSLEQYNQNMSRTAHGTRIHDGGMLTGYWPSMVLVV